MSRSIKQLYIERPNEKVSDDEKIFSGVIYSLGIHALPGTKFKINDSSQSTFIIGPSGNFSMNFENNPISQIEYISSPSTIISYPIIIDIVYEEGGVM